MQAYLLQHSKGLLSKAAQLGYRPFKEPRLSCNVNRNFSHAGF
jgi:hypothetical protein